MSLLMTLFVSVLVILAMHAMTHEGGAADFFAQIAIGILGSTTSSSSVNNTAAAAAAAEESANKYKRLVDELLANTSANAQAIIEDQLWTMLGEDLNKAAQEGL